MTTMLIFGGSYLMAANEKEAAPDAIQNSASQEADTKSDPESSAPEQLTYPNVINMTYRSGESGEPQVIIYYPKFNNKPVDEAMRAFAEEQGADYEKDIKDSLSPDEEKPSNYEMWEMAGFYSLDRPNPNVVSVTFNIYSYSGGAHGNLFINCLNYDLKTGKHIEFSDIFKNTEKALEILSQVSEQKLRTELGDEADEDMLRSGTAPELNNFLNLSLTPAGVDIEFQPYQVGPWSIGAQRVEVSLAELEAAEPNPEIWPQDKPAGNTGK